MKYFKCILSLSLMVTPFSISMALVSSITEVELYPSGASIIRLVELDTADLEAGMVELSGLPSNLIASSIQIAHVGESGLRLGSFSFLPHENPVLGDDPRTADLRGVLDDINQALRGLHVESETIRSRISHYQKLADSLSKSLEEGATADTFELAERAWAKVETVRLEGEARLAEIMEGSRALEIRKKEAQKNLNEKVAALGRLAGVLRFEVTGEASGDIQFHVSYQVREASWQPVHEIRATPAEGIVEWVYKAQIHQNSGEDWDAVAVTLNSASAMHAGSLPHLNPLFLERMQPRPMPLMQAEGRMKAESMAVYEMAPMAIADAAEPESTTTGFLMRIPGSLSLVSGESPTVREAFTKTLDADFWSEAVPELSTDAWLMAGITNDLGWPILAGDSYSYIDGQLVARRWIPAHAAGEEIEFSLGKNEKIQIERMERTKMESESGLIGKTKRHDFKFETTVENRMDVAHRIVLQDRFPVGRDDEIQVRPVQPGNVQPEEGTGIFKWERELQPGGSAVMTTEYSVLYPADWIIHPPL